MITIFILFNDYNKMPSIDLMVHVTYCHLQSNSFREIETLFNIPKTTAHRWYTQCSKYFEDINNTNKVIDIMTEKKDKQIEENNQNILNNNRNIIRYINKSLSIQPFQTQHDLQNKIEKKFNVSLTIKTISKYIKNSGFSKKKITRRLYNKNLKEHQLKRKQFRKFIKKIPKDDIICLDETGINRNTHSKYGYWKTINGILFNK